MTEKYYKFIVDVGSNKPYYYSGYIIKDNDEDGFLTIQDERVGAVRINKSRIISQEQVNY